MAQPGSAPALGAGGRQFESDRPDSGAPPFQAAPVTLEDVDAPAAWSVGDGGPSLKVVISLSDIDAMPEWIRSSRTLDGVRLLTGDGDDELLDAGIVFGVGHCDETLATSGFSHLVEHLALRGLEGDGVNGSVRGAVTEFHIRGTRAQIGEFFEQLGPRLAAPPIEDLNVERRVLLAESDYRARERPDSLDMLPIQFGWRGLGLESLFETGLRSVTPEALTGWARRWFTRSNAICWSTADLSAMRLNLPDGTLPAHDCRPARPTHAGSRQRHRRWD